MHGSHPLINRRRHRRIRVSLPARISTLDAELDPATGDPCFQALETLCENVSTGGALLRCTEAIAPGKRILAEILLTSGRCAEPIGRVAWAKRASSGEQAETCLGIEFLADAPELVAGLDV